MSRRTWTELPAEQISLPINPLLKASDVPALPRYIRSSARPWHESKTKTRRHIWLSESTRTTSTQFQNSKMFCYAAHFLRSDLFKVPIRLLTVVTKLALPVSFIYSIRDHWMAGRKNDKSRRAYPFIT